MLFRSKEYMLGDKMPDSPDALLNKGQLLQPNVTINAHKYSIAQNSNGTLSPRPPSSGRSPSPSMSSGPSSSPTSSHRADGNGLTSKGRQVIKVKRFLSTLQQFANDISAETGDKVHGLILGLVAASVSVEEFHQKIQEITNYPLRPFAIPFLKTHLPLLQTEVLQFSRMAKQSPHQYLRYHEHVFLDTRASPSVQHSTEPFEIFLSDTKENGKRISPTNRKSVSDFDDGSADGLPPAKRHQSIPSPNLGTGVNPAAPSSHLSGGLNYRADDPVQLYRDNRYDRYERIERDLYRPFYGGAPRDYAEEREMEEEWRNIHTMLNCILGMVEKTKRALAILQHRSYTERAELNHWSRVNRHLDTDHKKPSRPPDIVSHYKPTEDRISEVRRRAKDWQEAVNEVKRQAVAELQKAVSAAEAKAHELVSSERIKMERLLSDARRQATEEALATASHQEESEEACWNCGREAHETCSGCNKARYCGSFCQHKNWDAHLRVCGQISTPTSLTTTKSTTAVTSQSEKSSSPPRTSLLDVKNIKTDI